MAKDYALTFYKSKVWQFCRNSYVKYSGGLCEVCLAKGVYRPGVIVHHKVPLTPDNINDPSVALNFDNLQLVCRDCHAKLHGSTKRYKIAPDGTVTIRD